MIIDFDSVAGLICKVLLSDLLIKKVAKDFYIIPVHLICNAKNNITMEGLV